ncbi:MAG: hypothetical protein HZA54_11645, partial [Planctomycetes bacterium]|nr:hypothetical protein [Planctomycetota bacterium]
RPAAPPQRLQRIEKNSIRNLTPAAPAPTAAPTAADPEADSELMETLFKLCGTR